MNKKELTDFILDTYNIAGDLPWSDSPDYVVFRHPENQKWFALIMDVPKTKLGLEGDGLADIVNLKCDPGMIVSLTAESGIFPAYHMSKANWITVVLDGTVPDEKLKTLVDISFGLTEKKISRRSSKSSEVQNGNTRDC